MTTTTDPVCELDGCAAGTNGTPVAVSKQPRRQFVEIVQRNRHLTLRERAMTMAVETLRMRVDTLNQPSREYWDECFEIATEDLGMNSEQAAREAYARVMQWWGKPGYQAIVEEMRCKP